MLLGAGLLALAGDAWALDVRPVLLTGIDFGGDVIDGLVLTNGDTKEIRANEGFYLGGGLGISNAAKTIETQVTLSWKYTSVSASNQDISWKRFPLDAIVFFRLSDRFRLGPGLTYQLSPELKYDGSLANGSVRFDDSLGAIVELDYRLTPNITFGMRYTSVDFKYQGMTAFKGDGIGLALNASF
jgi:hypothetical protein